MEDTMNKKFVQSLILSIVLSLICTAVALILTKHFSCPCKGSDEENEPFDEDDVEESEA